MIALFQLHFHLTLRGRPRGAACARSQTTHTSRSAASIVSSVSHLAMWISCKRVWSSLSCFCPYQCDLGTDASWGRRQCRWSLFAGSLSSSYFSLLRWRRGSILSPLLLAQCTASSHLAPNPNPIHQSGMFVAGVRSHLSVHCTQRLMRGFICAEGIIFCLGLNEWGLIAA